MTLYYSLVFMLLMAEMGLFVVLIVPLPFAWKRKIFTFLSESPIVAKIQYGMKITFIFILILFIDSVNRVYRVQTELAATAESGNTGAAVLGRERTEVHARKFYSQRNMYLCGFTLFLSLILNRTYSMILELLLLEEKLEKYESAAKPARGASDADEASRLRKELAKKDVDLQTLQKQAAGLQREYDDLCEKYGATQAPAGPKKTQ